MRMIRCSKPHAATALRRAAVLLGILAISLWIVPPASSVDCASDLGSFLGGGCGDDSTEYTVKVLFVTFANVLDEIGDTAQVLPSYADSVMADIEDYIAELSYNDARLDIDIVKRAGADSVYYWTVPAHSDTLSTGYDPFNELPPDGWRDNADVTIYALTDATESIPWAPSATNGYICDGTHDSRIATFTGRLAGGAWLPTTRNWFETVLVHEMGHSFGAAHLPWGPTGEDPGCHGPYYGCFGAMQYWAPGGCSDGQTTENDGLIPYHPMTLVSIGFLRPDTISTSTNNVSLGDVRLYEDAAVYVPLFESGSSEGLLITNHQLTSHDKVLGERGLAIWHYSATPTEDPFGCGLPKHILDLEHPGNKWQPIDAGDYDDWDAYCADDRMIPDADAGADTLDCDRSGLDGALWSGTALTPGLYRSLSRNTNPNTNSYETTATVENRLSAQTDTTGVSILNIEAVTDPMFPGKYILTFDIEVNYP